MEKTMNKYILLGVFAAALAACAGTDTIDSSNTLGIYKVTGSNSEVVVPVPFVKIGGGDIDLASLMYIDNLAGGNTVNVCANSEYGYYDVWQKIQATDTTFTPSKRGDITPAAAAEFPVKRGMGIKVNTDGAVYIMGQHATGDISTKIESGKRSYMVNPLATDLVLDTKLDNHVLPGLDAVYVGNKTYYYNATGKDGKHWYYQQKEVKDEVIEVSKVYENITIPPGGAFVIVHGSTGDLEFTW